MSVLEKTQKALEFLKHNVDDKRVSEIQQQSMVLGQCMSAMGHHPSLTANYTTLLHDSIPILLFLCSHHNSELRLVGDETLNRVIVGGMPFLASKVHLYLHNHIIPTQDPRWLRAAISRICIGKSWLRAGMGRGRLFAQSTIQKFKDILQRLSSPSYVKDKGDQLLMECFELHLPRIIKAIAPYTTKDELLDLTNSFIAHVDSAVASIRRSVAVCVAELCGYHQHKLVTHVINKALDALASDLPGQQTILGWFGLLRALLSLHPLKSLPQGLLSSERFMSIYKTCLQHIESELSDHNVQNSAMEVLAVLLTDCPCNFKRELLNPKGPVCLFSSSMDKHRKTHQRSLSSTSMVQSVISNISLSNANLSEDGGLFSENSESITFHGALMLGGMSQHHTPYRSMEDLSLKGLNTPDSLCESIIHDIQPEVALSPEQLSFYVTERLGGDAEEEIRMDLTESVDLDQPQNVGANSNLLLKINIGSFYDMDVPLKFCSRLLASRFLLSGAAGHSFTDRSVRVSVRASAISCLSCIITLYPECLTVYLDKDFLHNQSGNSEFSNMSCHDRMNDIVVERNICYQESMTDSFGQELMNKSGDLSNHSSLRKASSSSHRKERHKMAESVDNSLAGVPSAMLDSSFQQHSAHMAASGASDATNQAMSISNFTMGSNMTASNDPLSTDFLMTSSVDPLTSSLDLEIKFDHFGESSNNSSEINPKHHTFHDMFLRHDANTVIERQTSNDSKSSSKSDDTEEGKRELKKPPSERNFGESKVMLETVEEASRIEDESSQSRSEPDGGVIKTQEEVCGSEEMGPQHMSDVIFLYHAHSDPHIRGLVRMAMGSFISAVLDAGSGDYYKWKALGEMSKEFSDNLQISNLVNIILQGLSDEIHSCVVHSLTALSKFITQLSMSCHSLLLALIFNSLRCVEENPYWLCKVNLCRFYEKLPYQILRIILSDWVKRGDLILNIMIEYLGEEDHRVRAAAVETIARFPYFLRSPCGSDYTSLLTSLAGSYTDCLHFMDPRITVDPLSEFKDMFVKCDLPGPLKFLQKDSSGEEDCRKMEESDTLNNNLKNLVSTLSFKLMESSSKFFTQGCLESLLRLTEIFPPTSHPVAYIGLGLLDTCIHLLENRTLTVSCTQTLIDFVTQIYSIAAWNILNQSDGSGEECNPVNSATSSGDTLWQHFPGKCGFSQRSESLLRVSLKLLNILIHILEDITPVCVVAQQKASSIIPPSPIRRRTETPKRVSLGGGDSPLAEDKGPMLRRRTPFNPTNPSSGSAFPMGYFASDSALLKLYANLRAAYSTHKVSLDPTSSIFIKFMSTILNSVAVQLEFLSEKEAGLVAEELLFYVKALLPLNPDNAVFCVTQVLKCLSSTNITALCADLNEYFHKCNVYDTLARWEKMNDKETFKQNFYTDILLNRNNNLEKICGPMKDYNSSNCERRASSDSNKSAVNNFHLKNEKDSFNNTLALSKCKADKKWNANKKDLEKYIRLIEPAVIQALKSYTMQNNIPLQCRVLELLNQLLSLRINYFLLDSDQVFIGFVLKQLENIENHELIDCGRLVRCIFTFLVHLSSIKHNHHNKQLMDIPKLIQLCDGLLASGVHWECVEAMHPVSYKVFVPTPVTLQSRAQIQEARVAREVLFAMRHKIMHDPKVLRLISSILVLCAEHGEAHFHWSSVALDSLLQLMKQGVVELDSPESLNSVRCLLRVLHPQLIYHQGKLDSVLMIMLEKPPSQDISSMETKRRWLATILLLLENIVSKYAENEILLSLNTLKVSHISPASIFFNMDNEIDPLNAQNVNENCVNLSPDVIFVRFLFCVITYALKELKGCDGRELNENGSMVYWCGLTTSFICYVKEILYLKDGCRFPLLAKTAQSVLLNEQSGLNTGLYEPEENIPLMELASICNSLSWWQPLLSVHWCHLLVRLKFLEQKYWTTLFGFLQNASIHKDNSLNRNLQEELLHVGCMMALCEHFVDNGLEEVVYLTWLLVNRIHMIVRYSHETVVRELLDKVNSVSSASGLLLQAVAARCHNIKGVLGSKVCQILSNCHPSQSGSLLVYLCRVIGGLPPSISHAFARLALTRCRYLLSLTIEEVNEQLAKEDVQMVLDTLRQDQVHLRHPQLIEELNILASTFFDLSPIVFTQDRPINPQYIKTTNIDSGWLLKQIKNRCYANLNELHVFGKLTSQAKLLQSLDVDQLNTIINCPEFDKQILCQMLRLGTHSYIVKLVDEAVEWDSIKRERNHNYFTNCPNYYTSYAMRNEQRSQFYISVKDLNESTHLSGKFGKLKLELKEDPLEIIPPAFDNYLSVALVQFEKMVQSLVSLFPRQSRPLSQFDTGTYADDQTMDKYTRRCFQVFRDKQFHQELLAVQNILAAYLHSHQMLQVILKDMDFQVKEKLSELFLPNSLAKSLMSFSVIALQYTSYLINMVENDQSSDFRSMNFRGSEASSIDYTMRLCVTNASVVLNLQAVWKQLNMESNATRVQSAINCLYGFIRYTVKETLPIQLSHLSHRQSNNYEGVVGELALTCDKLLSLLKFWQDRVTSDHPIMSYSLQVHAENLLVALSRCDFASSFALVPPLAWSKMDIFEEISKQPTIGDLQVAGSHTTPGGSHIPEKRIKKQIPIPIDTLQDMDVLEQFMYRVNLIGWSSKKGFEEIWMSLLAALQGNGAHWAVKGVMQLILSTHYSVGGACGRPDTTRMLHGLPSHDFRKLKAVALCCGISKELFDETTMESYLCVDDKYNYSTYSVEYLLHAAGVNDNPDIRTQNVMKEIRRNVEELGIDIESCLQLLMDVATQAFLPEGEWGIGGRASLLSCMVGVTVCFTRTDQWAWLGSFLQNVASTTDQRDLLTQHHIQVGTAMVKAVLQEIYVDSHLVRSCFTPSGQALIRTGALHALQLHLRLFRDLHSKHIHAASVLPPPTMQSMVAHLEGALHDTQVHRLSLYERSIQWRLVMMFIDLGHETMLTAAANFLLTNMSHPCFHQVMKGVCWAIMQHRYVLNAAVKDAFFKLITSQPHLCHSFLPLMLTLIYSEVIPPVDGVLEPEQLLSSMQRASLLQSAALTSPPSQAADILHLMSSYAQHFLTPHAIVHKITLEFVECCRWADMSCVDRKAALSTSQLGLHLTPCYAELMAYLIYTVFETSIAENQLPVLSGWLFDVLEHILNGKISQETIPLPLLCLIVCSSDNPFIRAVAPAVFHTMRSGFHNKVSDNIRPLTTSCFTFNSSHSTLPNQSSMYSGHVEFEKSKYNPNGSKLSFTDKRLLCLSMVHSGFTDGQRNKLKELCLGNGSLNDLLVCL